MRWKKVLMKIYVTSFTILPQFVLAGTEEATEELRKFDVSDEIPMTHLYNPSQKKLLFMFFSVLLFPLHVQSNVANISCINNKQEETVGENRPNKHFQLLHRKFTLIQLHVNNLNRQSKNKQRNPSLKLEISCTLTCNKPKRRNQKIKPSKKIYIILKVKLYRSK